MTRALLLAALVALSGCVALTPGVTVTTAEDGVEAGLASCLTAIGRPDVAADTDAPMSDAEIEALLTCTSERAGG